LIIIATASNKKPLKTQQKPPTMRHLLLMLCLSLSFTTAYAQGHNPSFSPEDSTAWVNTMLQIKARAYQRKLKQNPTFLEEKNKIVLAPLYRLRERFKNKIIVTDITGSMYGYMEQVMLWHALNFMTESSNKSETGKDKKYLFFNDGDGKGTSEKTIGSRGGLYFCQGQIKEFKVL
jgi:hypothetical protein